MQSSLEVLGYFRRSCSRSNPDGQDTSANTKIKGTIDYCINHSTGDVSAIVTPKPLVEDQESLMLCFEAWLPHQSLKPPFLRQWNTEIHDTGNQVETAATDRASEGGTAWVMPLAIGPLANQQSKRPPVLTLDNELTNSHWEGELAARVGQESAETGEAAPKTGQRFQQESLAPMTMTSGTQITNMEGSDLVVGGVRQTNSAPFYTPAQDQEPNLYGDSSAGAWGS